MDGPYIASLDLVALHPDGARNPLVVRVGAPEKVGAEEWRCHLTLAGLEDGLVPMHGADSLQALCLALGLGATVLRGFIADGGRLLFPDEGDDAAGERDWPVDAYFGSFGALGLQRSDR